MNDNPNQRRLAQVNDIPIEPHPFVTGDRVRVINPRMNGIVGKLGVIDHFGGAMHVAGSPVRKRLVKVILDGHMSPTTLATDDLRKEHDGA